MRITDAARDLHKLLKAKNVEITREQIIEVLRTQSEDANYKLSHGEPFEIFNVGVISPKLKHGKTHFKIENNESGEYTTVSFSVKITPEIKRKAKSKIPKV